MIRHAFPSPFTRRLSLSSSSFPVASPPRPRRGPPLTVVRPIPCSSSSSPPLPGNHRLLCSASFSPALPRATRSRDCRRRCAAGGRSTLEWAGEVVSMAYPLWIALACFLGLWRPSTFAWVDQRWQITGLSLAMLGMGMTLTLDDLKGAFLMTKEFLIGCVLQYTVMPLSGFVVCKLLRLPSHYAAGLILLGCCPGGTASNIITYLARGNVALSVLMTAASTILAVVMTPLLTLKLAGQYVAVDPWGLFTSTVQIVLAPILLGATVNHYYSKFVEVISPLTPVVAVVTSAALCGSVIAQNAPAILSSGLKVVFASCLLHGSGFLFGYMLSRLLGLSESCSRTISIEVGMQNSVLGLVLAARHFDSPLATIPCAVSSLCHLVYGSILAGVWRGMPISIHGKE